MWRDAHSPGFQLWWFGSPPPLSFDVRGLNGMCWCRCLAQFPVSIVAVLSNQQKSLQWSTNASHIGQGSLTVAERGRKSGLLSD